METSRFTDVQRSIFEKYKNVSRVVKNAKNALINSRTPNGFTDKNFMKEPGILAESSALIGLLLLVEAFYNNATDENGETNPVIKEVEDTVDFASDIDTVKTIQRQSLELIYNWYKDEGFTARPLIVSSYEDLFNSEDSCAAYIDSLTYALSAAILSRWLDIQGKLVLDEDLRQKNTEILIKGIDVLLNAQHEDGLWGFRADTESESALFFTYSAGVTIADFFDYILGEIAYTVYAEKDLDEQERLVATFKDTALIAEINSTLGGDIEQRINSARNKVQNWLLLKCLPRMPKIAQCEVANDEQKKDYTANLGMWFDTAIDAKYARYFNLNYTYYLIDLMVILSTDKRYEELCQDFDSEEWKAFEASCRSVFDMQDQNFYFFNAKTRTARAPELWKNCMAQTIHASRAQYMAASRTEEEFWDSAELKIRWKHNGALSRSVRILENDNRDRINTICDPAIVPMALRANTNFSYYISMQTDMEVDRLFGDICGELATVTNERNTVADLWDGNKYNIQLTERSIEAVVDYYDYLNKYECAQLLEVSHAAPAVAAAPAATPVASAKSPLDLAIEAKIAEYLNSEEGKKLIENSVGAKTAVVETPVAPVSPVAQGVPSDTDIGEWIEELSKDFSQCVNFNGSRGELMENMLKMFEVLRNWSFRYAISDIESLSSNEVANISNGYDAQRQNLLKAVGMDVKNSAKDDNMYDLNVLYQTLKEIRNK